jgi:hypothetical protein
VGATTSDTVECTGGRLPIGGGATTSADDQQVLVESAPTATGWTVTVRNAGLNAATFAVHVVCATGTAG